MKPKPRSSIEARSAPVAARAPMPSSSSTSAEPACELAARLPCFATPAPAAAATSAAAVEMLKVWAPSPPGADDVDDGRALRRHGNDVLAHRLGEAGDLVRRLALRAQRDEEPGDLRVRRLAVHDRAHQLARVGAREMVPVEQQLDRGADDHRRKFLAIVRPERRQHALRMELHALDRQLAVAHAHHLAVGRVRGDGRAPRESRAPPASGSARPRHRPAAPRRPRGRRGRSCSPCREAAPSPGRRCRRTPPRSPGGRGRRRAWAWSARARGSARSRRPRSRAGRGRGRRRAGRSRRSRASSTVIASFRTVTTSAPSSSNRCTRL